MSDRYTLANIATGKRIDKVFTSQTAAHEHRLRYYPKGTHQVVRVPEETVTPADFAMPKENQ